jgi:hypothetical protein
MGRRYSFKVCDEGEDFFRAERPKVRRGERRSWDDLGGSAGRQTLRRVQVFWCSACHEPCESARDLCDHLQDCGGKLFLNADNRRQTAH